MKKIIVMLLAAGMCLSLIACGNISYQLNTEDSAEGSMENNVVVENIEINKETEKSEDIGKEVEVEVEAEAEVAKEEEVVVDNTPIIEVGGSAVTDTCEFMVDYVNITGNVIPPKPGSWYSHYEADDGKVYVDFCVAYKNTNTANIDADETISGLLIYNGKYEYKGFSMIEEDNRSDFTYSNITSIAPLSTEYVHYLFEVPKEVETSGAEIVLKMTIGGKDYKIIVREGNGVTEENTAPEQNSKTSGEVAIGEVLKTKNSEFNIDYSNITKDVIPPKPDSWYSHYEADEGKVYVDICFAYKNTGNKNVDADEVISAKLKYADKYEYTGFSMIEEDSRADFTYSNITSIAPLSTEYVHYLFEVPEEVSTSNNSIEIFFDIDGNSYTYKVK